ncbi:NF-kappa-B essential modulator NEMO family protein [Anoxybacillus amylolyticus]|uniref:NF-kappa-B essential modulator NEMO family protein n=1 Tax=Anoxybacteroides amylolyticum TaxID=294699 RepID=A0A167T911_9BACL|nr:NF-kappa-B essential modulator NEMO family protein [Anoxybacillus amylolyticus]
MAKGVFDFQQAVFTLESMFAKIEHQAQTIEKLIKENEQLRQENQRLRQENQQLKTRMAELEARTKKTVPIAISRRPLTDLWRNLLLANRRRNSREGNRGTEERRSVKYLILTNESFTA